MRPGRHAARHTALGGLGERQNFYDGSPETRHAQNITQNPRVSLHLESGDEAVIVEGESKASGKPPRELAEKIASSLSR